jgi:hypothetical protein
MSNVRRSKLLLANDFHSTLSCLSALPCCLSNHDPQLRHSWLNRCGLRRSSWRTCNFSGRRDPVWRPQTLERTSHHAAHMYSMPVAVYRYTVYKKKIQNKSRSIEICGWRWRDVTQAMKGRNAVGIEEARRSSIRRNTKQSKAKRDEENP